MKISIRKDWGLGIEVLIFPMPLAQCPMPIAPYLVFFERLIADNPTGGVPQTSRLPHSLKDSSCEPWVDSSECKE